MLFEFSISFVADWVGRKRDCKGKTFRLLGNGEISFRKKHDGLLFTDVDAHGTTELIFFFSLSDTPFLFVNLEWFDKLDGGFTNKSDKGGRNDKFGKTLTEETERPFFRGFVIWLLEVFVQSSEDDLGGVQKRFWIGGNSLSFGCDFPRVDGYENGCWILNGAGEILSLLFCNSFSGTLANRDFKEGGFLEDASSETYLKEILIRKMKTIWIKLREKNITSSNEVSESDNS